MKKTLVLLSLCSAFLFAAQEAVIFGLNGDSFLSLREKPVDGAKIAKLYNGEKLTVSEKNGAWYHVKVVKSGQTGWAHENWVKVAPEAAKTATKSNVPVLKEAKSHVPVAHP